MDGSRRSRSLAPPDESQLRAVWLAVKRQAYSAGALRHHGPAVHGSGDWNRWRPQCRRFGLASESRFHSRPRSGRATRFVRRLRPFLFRRFLPTVRTRYAAGGFVQRRGRSVGSGAESGPRRTMRLEVIRVSRGSASTYDGDRTPISHCVGFRQGYAVGSRSSRNSEAGSVPVTRSRSRARVHATYSRWRSVL